MRKLTVPLIALVLVASAFAAVAKLTRDRRAARAENAVLAERLARAEAVSAAVVKIDKLYRESQDANAALTGRLAIAEAASQSCRTEFKDAVADRPKSKKRRPARREIKLPGFND
ncbi:MAG: hypothetical protein ACHQ2Z_02745 [Elusimicrobiota bacterium]